MYRIIIEEVTPAAGKKPKVTECYRQEFADLSVLEMVAKINAPTKAPRVRTKKTAGASA